MNNPQSDDILSLDRLEDIGDFWHWQPGSECDCPTRRAFIEGGTGLITHEVSNATARVITDTHNGEVLELLQEIRRLRLMVGEAFPADVSRSMEERRQQLAEARAEDERRRQRRQKGKP